MTTTGAALAVDTNTIAATMIGIIIIITIEETATVEETAVEETKAIVEEVTVAAEMREEAIKPAAATQSFIPRIAHSTTVDTSTMTAFSVSVERISVGIELTPLPSPAKLPNGG